jgi:hypothetical protein
MYPTGRKLYNGLLRATDPFLWWMTADSISIDVQRLFSRGCLVLSHTRNRLATQTMRAIICLGTWSKMGLIKDNDVLAVAKLEDVEGKDNLDEGWDAIVME